MSVARTLPEALLRAADSGRGYFFVEEDGAERFVPYREILQSALSVAAALQERGLVAGDRVAIIVPESEPFLRAFFGVSVAGFVPVPMYPPMNMGQLESYLEHSVHIIRASKARALLTTNQVKLVLGTLASDCPSVRHILSMETLSAAPLAHCADVSLEDTAFLQFTSGSTSQPKGVTLTHRNLSANIAAFVGTSGVAAVSGVDIGVSWLPLFHDMGLIGMALSPMYVESSTVLLSPLLFLKRPVEWLRAIARHKGTVSFAPNFAYGLCVKRVKDKDLAGLDLSSWRIAGCGAEPIQAETLLGFARRFASVGFRETSFLPCYGMAEHTLAVTFSQKERGLWVDTVDGKVLAAEKRAMPCEASVESATAFVACGVPFPDHELQIRDELGNVLSERQVGEICLRGPSVMKGYDGQAERSADTLRGGWLHTGDLGYRVGDELFVCGRQKDLIILHGRNYYPQDLEWAAGEVEGIRKGNVVAFGCDAFAGQEKVVLVAERRDSQVNTQGLVETVQHRVQNLCGLRPDEVLLVPPGTIPKTSSGKLQRAKTKERYEAGTLQRPSGGKLAVARHLVRSQLGFAKAFARKIFRTGEER